MRPSSSASDGLFGAVLSRGAVDVSDRAWLQALLDVEGALARACASAGLVPVAAAARISEVCRTAAAYDPVALGRDAGASGNPVVPLVREIERLAGPEAGPHVHRGATSQDVLDTAMVLLARRAAGPLVADLRGAADAAGRLAQAHRDTPVAGRTLGQQAVPTTFGLKAAGWLTGLGGAADRLQAVAAGLPVQLGGAAGTLAAHDGRGLQVLAALAAELELPEPVLPWHAVRLPVADLAGALGTAAGVVGKVALDVVLLAQTEVAEVAEASPGGSSAMPHKRNPVAAVCARAAALRAPGLVATLLLAMHQEHERAAGAWHAEWETVSDLLRVTGSAAAWLRTCLAGLQVDADRMLTNLEDTGSEALVTAAAPALGRARAHELVRLALATGERPAELAAALAGALPGALPGAIAQPGPGTGDAGALVDRALDDHRRRRA